jgi:hypothetical protein
MDDLFNLETTDFETPKMTAEDFITKTKKVLNEISREYSQSWYSRRIEDAEAEIAPCENCKGTGCFKMGEKEIECAMDREQGECYERCFDGKSFLEFMEQEIMFENHPFFDLISCEIVDTKMEGSTCR